MKITLVILIAALVSGCEIYDAGGYGYNGYAQPYYYGGYGYNGYGYAQPYYYGGPSLYLPPVVIGNYGGYGGYRYGGGYGYRRPYYYQRPYARPYYRLGYRTKRLTEPPGLMR